VTPMRFGQKSIGFFFVRPSPTVNKRLSKRYFESAKLSTEIVDNCVESVWTCFIDVTFNWENRRFGYKIGMPCNYLKSIVNSFIFTQT